MTLLDHSPKKNNLLHYISHNVGKLTDFFALILLLDLLDLVDLVDLLDLVDLVMKLFPVVGREIVGNNRFFCEEESLDGLLEGIFDGKVDNSFCVDGSFQNFCSLSYSSAIFSSTIGIVITESSSTFVQLMILTGGANPTLCRRECPTLLRKLSSSANRSSSSSGVKSSMHGTQMLGTQHSNKDNKSAVISFRDDFFTTLLRRCCLLDRLLVILTSSESDDSAVDAVKSSSL